MRPSSYNIIIELENNPDQIFLAHGYTLAFDLIRKSVYDCLRGINGKSIDDINPQTLETLKNRGYLTTKTKEEEYQHVQKIAKVIANKQQNNGNSFLFAVCHDCNFRCEYCYENLISLKGKNWSKILFTKSLVDRAFEAMMKIQPDRNKHSNIIGLYGGEPLMGKNYDIVKYIVSVGNERGYVFRAITNGYDLNVYKELLGPDKINFLQITIDGLNDTHNKRRPHYKNNDSFSRILNNVEIALEKDSQVALRINIDDSNFDEIENLVLLFSQKGWLGHRHFSVSMANVQSSGNCEKMQMQQLEKILALKRQKSILKPLHTRENMVSGLINHVIRKDTYFLPKVTYCGAHNGMYILDPYGDIYTCWDKFGMKNHVVGNFKDILYFNETALNVWRGRSIMTVKRCSKCKYALICAGGCAGTLHPRESLDIYRPNCENYPKIFAKAVNEMSLNMNFNR